MWKISVSAWRVLPETEAAAPQKKTWPSIEDAMPNEQGGPVARQGFSYQDEIAVGFMLDMIEDTCLLKIHFETHDDLILVRTLGASPTATCAEFVQVKGGEPDKLWSVADICQRKSKDAVGTSIFETSLGRDKHEEIAAFRMVTLRPVVSDLTPLTYTFGSDGRKPGCEAMMALEMALNSKLPGLKSPKDNGCGYWWIFRSCEATVPAHVRPVFRAMGGQCSGPWEASDGDRLRVVGCSLVCWFGFVLFGDPFLVFFGGLVVRFFAHGFAGQLDQFSVVDEAVEDGVGESRIFELAVPEFNRQLAGDDHAAALVAVFEQFEQQRLMRLAHRHQAEVVEYDDLDSAQGFQPVTGAALRL